MRQIKIVTAIIASFIVVSCSKDSNNLSITNFNLEEAKAIFVLDYNDVISTKSENSTLYYSIAGGDYTPLWDMAKTNENDYEWSFEVPIISDFQIVLKNNDTGAITLADRRLLFVKNKFTLKVSSYVLTSTISTESKYSNTKYEHLADNSAYTGIVLYSKLDGAFVNLLCFTSGVEVANISTNNTTNFNDCDHEDCSVHNHSSIIKEVIGNSTFGIIHRGAGGGNYYEGICIGCGVYAPGCFCDIRTCSSCGGNYSHCGCDILICTECGKFKKAGIYSNIHCECDMMGEDASCNFCGGDHDSSECSNYCEVCGRLVANCECK